VYPDLPYRITMQHLVPDSSLYPLPDDDARLVGTEGPLPPMVILDYVYGVAAYNNWRSGKKDVHEKLVSYYKDHYEPALTRPPPMPTDDFDNGQQYSSSDDDKKDTTYDPGHNTRERGEGRPQEYLDAMDAVLALTLRIQQQMIPQEVLAKVQQQRDEAQLRERDVSRMKVEEWRRTISDNSSMESSNPIRPA
jgi:hypothetical protein